MGLTTDPNDPCLREHEPDGQQSCYLVLSEEERAKGFVRPVRTKYIHVGCRPKGPTRELTAKEHEQYDQFGYVLFEPSTGSEGSGLGRYWTKDRLESGCGAETTMPQAIAETYARDPTYYGGTFCCNCGKHFPVGVDGEFVWEDGSRVGT
jgi:hypothetical protein